MCICIYIYLFSPLVSHSYKNNWSRNRRTLFLEYTVYSMTLAMLKLFSFSLMYDQKICVVPSAGAAQVAGLNDHQISIDQWEEIIDNVMFSFNQECSLSILRILEVNGSELIWKLISNYFQGLKSKIHYGRGMSLTERATKRTICKRIC